MLETLLWIVALVSEGEIVGERPYELVWAGRDEDAHEPLVDFEDLAGWSVETHEAAATLERTREQQLWGQHVAKLTYRGAGASPSVRLVPPAPTAIPGPFDAVTLWAFGNNWGWAPDPSTPQVSLGVLLEDSSGRELGIHLHRVDWKEWNLLHRRLSPAEIERVREGARLRAITVTGGTNLEDRTLYLDNLAVFTEEFPPLQFEPRPGRGIPMLPGQATGTNTGPGRLPFPTRPETILPSHLTEDFATRIDADGNAFVFTYSGEDGELAYRIEPETGTLSDVSARWEGRGSAFRPCDGGGVRLAAGGRAVPPERSEHLGSRRVGETVESRWRLEAGPVSVEVAYTYRLWAKSLVIDVAAPGGAIAEVSYGRAVGLERPRLVTNPFYLYGRGRERPAVTVSGPPESPLFLAGNTDWCLSGASVLWAANDVSPEGVAYNGGTRYTARTDGRRNDCHERLFVTVSPRYEEVLPNIPNPPSPWRHVTGTRVWRAHGASDRERDAAHWRECHRYGMTQVVITDHETGWRDGGESFTFRTRAAPGKGGDRGQYEYARVLQDELGFVYGPYNNFTDFAPVNEHWSVDRVSRTPDNQLQHAWMRCYAPKPARAVEYCARLAPEIERKFHFSTAYCDVHTAVAPWDRTDYDARVPGAGTFAAVFYAFGEIMLLQKKAWDGPVYSEGTYHYLYCGLTDGNYGQDNSYEPWKSPWLVDFDLRKLHDLACNFGMGNLGMFYGQGRVGGTREEMDAQVDRFLAATVAFGHPGFLVYEGGLHNALRSYYLLQQLHSRYCLASAVEIRYADADGRLLETSEAIAAGIHERSQVVTRYSDGTVCVVNGHPTERLVVEVAGRRLDLPPNGYAGWTADGEVQVTSGDLRGRRADCAETPDYLYVDGRGTFARFPRAASSGQAICRRLGEGRHEVIPYRGAECGFALPPSTATALDSGRRELGPAQLRTSRGLTYVVPVEGAFSYLLEPSSAAGPAILLACDRAEVVPGEIVRVAGPREHDVAIPRASKPGERLWRELDGAWIDFTVVPLADVRLSLREDRLTARVESRLGSEAPFEVESRGRGERVLLQPGEPRELSWTLAPPEWEDEEVLAVSVRSGDLQLTLERGLRTTRGTPELTPLPERWRAGLSIRGEAESADFDGTGGYVRTSRTTCGGVGKDGLALHPPYRRGVGSSFALLEPVTLPGEPAAFRASVGKGDGSDPGDGILYRLAIVDAEGTETPAAEVRVRDHGWLPLEADLTPWAGKTVRLKLIADVGPDDNSGGDWAAWAEMRIEALAPRLIRLLEDDAEPFRRAPGPHALSGLSTAELRSATRGSLRYEGKGLAGSGEEYGSFAELNGVPLGNLSPAAGDEARGLFAEEVRVPLSAEAIRSLGSRNVLVVRNPRRDFFSIRRFRIELELSDGRPCSSDVSLATYSQPPGWAHAEGILVPHGEDIRIHIWFPR